MKRIVILFAACVLGTGAMAQSMSDAEMKAWQDFMTPGDVHQMMAKWDGTWTATTRMWMEPGSAPQTSSGTSVNTMILGGRYQESKFKGEAMGMPFEGVSTVGYDKAKKKFISTWVDNMGTSIMMLTGTWDAASKSIRFSGTCSDPMNGKDVKVREVFTIKDDNNHMMEMWMTDPKTGKEAKTMEISYVRK